MFKNNSKFLLLLFNLNFKDLNGRTEIVKNNKPFLPLKKNQKKEIIDFSEIPSSIKNSIDKIYQQLSEEKRKNIGLFILIVEDILKNSSYFQFIKKIYEEQKTSDDFNNYLLLIKLIKEVLIEDSKEVLNQNYEIARLGQGMEFLLEVINLHELTEEELNTFKQLQKEQQSKDFIITNSFIDKVNKFLKNISKKSKKLISFKELYLKGVYIGFIPFPNEKLDIINFLKKYYIWITNEEILDRGYNLTIISGIKEKPQLTYEDFIENLKKQLLLKLIKDIIIYNKGKFKYTIEGKNPIEILDSMFAKLLLGK
jgi:hypothetical protein